MIKVSKYFTLFFMLILIFLLTSCGAQNVKEIDISHLIIDEVLNENLNPSNYGEYEIGKFTYASEYNPRRQFYSNPLIKTSTVDISKLFNNVDSKYWGYDSTEVPLNGIVWFPEGQGIFPVVLCVHGNSNPKFPSEKGYEYLGKLLASRGIIFVSVDQNYLNGNTSNENDARAFLMLKHAKEIISWNEKEGNPLKGKIDTNNIALIGHSRGGEAVATAGLFNEIKYYPENANLEFDFNLPLKALISIAPVEGQYRPSQRLVAQNSVNHLIIHGSQDGDVFVDMGLPFINRNTPKEGIVRSYIWIYGANHAQFNTDWAIKQDPFTSFEKNLLSLEDQLQISKVLITSFVEMSFGINETYRDFFKDFRTGINWLPSTNYISTVQSGNEIIISNYENKVCLSETNLNNWLIKADNFEKWIERDVILLSFPETMSTENYAVNLKWDLVEEEKAYYSIYSTENSISLDTLAFDLLVLEKNTDFIYFDIELKTTNGEIINLNLDDYYKVKRPPLVKILITPNMRRDLFQSIYIDFEETIEISEINFIFDRTTQGEILLDNIRYIRGEF